MLLYIWMCVMLQTFAPGGERIAGHYVHTLQSHVRAHVETLAADAPVRPLPTERARRLRSASVLAR